MNEGSGLDEKITTLGILLTCIVALFFYFSAGDLRNTPVIFLSFIFGYTAQLSLWYLKSKLKLFGKALLPFFFGLFILSYLPFSRFIVFASALILSIIFVRRNYKKVLSSFSTASWLLIFSIFYGIAICVSTSNGYGAPFLNESLRQFALNPDTLFHASIATMIKNYHQISVGLDGFTHVHYHFLSHALYGATASILGINAYEVYGYTHLIAYAPLFVTGYLRLLGEIPHRSRHYFALINLLILGGPLSLMFGWQWDSHFLSESYLSSLILLAGALSVLMAVIKSCEWRANVTWWLLIYIPFLCIAKISVGIIFCTAILVALAMNKRLPNKQKITIAVLTGVFGLLGYHLARTTPIPHLEVKFQWKFFQEKVVNDPSFFHFILTAFPYLFSLLPMFYFLKKEGQLNDERKTWFIILLVACFIGFLGLNITIDSSGYYFSNVHAFIALPIFAMLLSADSISLIQIHLKRKSALYAIILLSFFTFSASYYLLKTVPAQMIAVQNIKAQVMANRTYKNKYAEAFQIIHDDTDSNLMVYIPKSETSFWDNTDGQWSPWKDMQCINMPFYIPVLTGKPAIFGLPNPAKNCLTFFRGFESYSPGDYAASALRDYSVDDLCSAVKLKGFHGYYRVTIALTEKHICF